MTHPIASPQALRAPTLFLVTLLGGTILSGCLGGELDTSTVAPVPKDTAVVILPPKDSTPVHDTVPTGVAHSIYPRLKIGEKWEYSQYSGTDTGTVYSLEMVGESVFGSDSVYVEKLLVTAPPFVIDQFGTLAENYLQTGLIYLRKSDQETVHDSLARSMDFFSAGDTLGIHYSEESITTTRFTGSLPDSLKEGAAWKLAQVHSYTTHWAYPDTAGIDTGTSTRTRSYLVKAPAPVTVKAGTFTAFEIVESDSLAGSTTQIWFSPEAKGIVREIDTNPNGADTSEVSTILLK
ncbi:MAG: hypothetical protein JF616_22675 [Fibrobacteres bacterium]|nr:hypothetical protein [Fibrobacterota bacterium]